LISEDTETQYQTLQSIALPTELHSVLIQQPHRFRTKRCTRTHTHNHRPYIDHPHTPRSPRPHGSRCARQRVSNLPLRLQRTNATTRPSTSCPRGGAVAQTPMTAQLRSSIANDPASHRPGRKPRGKVRGQCRSIQPTSVDGGKCLAVLVDYPATSHAQQLDTLPNKRSAR
jgi:hypothetical protein